MPEPREVTVEFRGVSAAEGNVLAAELVQQLQEKAAESRPQVVKDDPATMDLGSTVVLILSTQFAVAIAYGIAAVLARRGAKATITEKVKTPAGSEERQVVLENISGDDVTRIVEALKG